MNNIPDLDIVEHEDNELVFAHPLFHGHGPVKLVQDPDSFDVLVFQGVEHVDDPVKDPKDRATYRGSFVVSHRQHWPGSRAGIRADEDVMKWLMQTDSWGDGYYSGGYFVGNFWPARTHKDVLRSAAERMVRARSRKSSAA